MRSITLQLTDEMGMSLDALGRERQCRIEELAAELFERALFLERLRRSRAGLRPYAERAGFHTDEDVFNAIS